MAELHSGRIIERDEVMGAKLLSMGIGRKGEEGVILEWLEAAYLVERKLLQVIEGKKVLALEDIISEPEQEKSVNKEKKKTKVAKSSSSSVHLAAPTHAEQYRIYRSIRGGGRVVRFSAGTPLYWRVYERGVGREQERPQMLLYVVPPEWSVSLSALEQQMQLARLLRLDLGLAFVRDSRPQLMKISRPPIEG